MSPFWDGKGKLDIPRAIRYASPMKTIYRFLIPYIVCVAIIGIFGFPLSCGGGSEADDQGVGAECTTADDCDEGQECLAFKGGYCGIEDCVDDDDCPDGSLCVAHTDGTDYCFLVCDDKSDCNINRSAEDESNCSANIVFVESHPNTKACVPPSAF